MGAAIVAAQHVGETLLVEDLHGQTDDADRLGIGAIGKIEAAQPVVGRGESDPGLGVARMFLDRAAEALLGESGGRRDRARLPCSTRHRRRRPGDP